jgi:hypothetical protein
MEITESLVRRFWKYTLKRDELECWNWNASTRAGYGCLKHQGKMVACHRLSYLIHHGPITDGLFVCHKCDNRLCVNPSHLELLLHRQNVIDGIYRGREKRGVTHVRGSECYNACLNEDLVKQIRQLRSSSNMGPSSIAKILNVSKDAIKQVIAGRTWKHVPMESAATSAATNGVAVDARA